MAGLKKGEFTKTPVKSQFGYHVIRLDDTRMPQLPPLETVRGEIVKLSSFATFQVRSKNERIGRNPKTGIEVPITPRRVMTFRASQLLKERIAKG